MSVLGRSTVVIKVNWETISSTEQQYYMFGKTVEHEMKEFARLKIDNYVLLLNYRVKCTSCKHNIMILRNIMPILVVELDGNS